MAGRESTEQQTETGAELDLNIMGTWQDVREAPTRESVSGLNRILPDK